MVRTELQKNIYAKYSDDKEKEIYLKELEKSLYAYIKLGVKNTQLDNWAELEEEFRKKYEERLNVKKIAKTMSNLIAERINQFENIYEQKIESRSEDIIGNEKKQEIDVEKISVHIEKTIVAVACDNLPEIINDIAYLSHMNMVYELYEHEEYMRKKEEEYKKGLEKFKKMEDILKSLNKVRRMQIAQLQKQVNIPENKLWSLLNQNKQYFNIRENVKTIQISLSPEGKKYCEYVMNSQQSYSKSTLDRLVYKNCDRLMEAIENSCDRGLEFDFELEEISPEKDRAIHTKCHRVMKKIITATEEIYKFGINTIIEESEDIENEKNRIRIPRGWD